MDATERLLPGLRVGERVTLQASAGGEDCEVVGFVVALDEEALGIQDRHGTTHTIPRDALRAARRLGVSRGRDPLRTPTALLDSLAARAGVTGTPYLARISDQLDGLTPPTDGPAWGAAAAFDGHEARFEGEWVTLGDASPETARAAAWWATRMGARSIQVRTGDPQLAEALLKAGFQMPLQPGKE